jgi:hypothetical protein
VWELDRQTCILWAALISQVFEGGPAKCGMLLLVQPLSALADSIECCLRLVLVDATIVWDKSCDGLSVACNDDLFAAFHTVQQGSKSIFRFERSDLRHAEKPH